MKKRCAKVGIVGATGMVGTSFLTLLESRGFHFDELRLFASENSEGQFRVYRGNKIAVQTLKPGCFKGLDLAFFSSGDDISAEWAPKAVSEGAWVVDNSAAFRMTDHPLVVPEVNGDLLDGLREPTIIANPNCSTIQLVVALRPLQQAFGIDNVTVASYQAVSGAGAKAQEELIGQLGTLARREYSSPADLAPQIFPHPIAFNCIPQVGSFNAEGFCSEEMKIMKETRKILRHPDLKISAMTVRVPALNSHAEAVWVRLKSKQDRESVLRAMRDAPGLKIFEKQDASEYPTQSWASGKEPTYVGRIHRDLDDDQRWIMWVVADNILKGAALNGLQIAERLFDFK